jgi:hypothetical protein
LRSTSCSWLAATAFIASRWRISHESECGSPAMFLGKALTVPLYSHLPPSLQDTEIQQTHFLNYITSRILVETVLEYILTSCYDGKNWKELLPETSNMRTEALHCRKSLDRSPLN